MNSNQEGRTAYSEQCQYFIKGVSQLHGSVLLLVCHYPGCETAAGILEGSEVELDILECTATRRNEFMTPHGDARNLRLQSHERFAIVRR